MATTLATVVVVGASLAGLNAARTLRKEGFDGRLIVVGAEPHRPYDRPPLSKDFLAGTTDQTKLALPGADDDALAIDWRLGVGAQSLDLGSRRVTLTDGVAVDFDGLVIATGGSARYLPGTQGRPGVHVLRTLDDALGLRRELEAMPKRVAVVGAGFIGAEVAATCRGRGLNVTIVEAAPVPLEHAVGARVGSACLELQRDHEVDVRVGIGVQGIEGSARAEGIRLADGSLIEADVVVVGVGVRPAVEWLEGSGLTLDNGVVLDATCSAAPGVVAAGDVARWPNPVFGGELMRVEHWDNAVSMGSHAARRLLHGESAGAYRAVPWFWSDQYDRKLQFAGRVRSSDDVEIVQGSVEERRFAAVYGRAGTVVGVFGMNRPRQVMQLRALIEAGAGYADALDRARG